MAASTAWIIGLIATSLSCAGLCAWLATQKHRDGSSWFMLGLLLSVLALIAIAGAPNGPEPEPGRRRPIF